MAFVLLSCSEKAIVEGPIKVTSTRDALEVETDEPGDQKAFKVKVENIGVAPVDLTDGCFVLVGPDKYKIVANTPVLDRTILPGQILEGSVVFAGPRSIFSAREVKFSTSCGD
jgi:hypothetical protein